MGPIKVIKVGLVRDAIKPHDHRKTIKGPADVVGWVQDEAHSDREMFIVLHLNARNVGLRKEVISIGTLNASLVAPREVFKSAVKENAAAIILVHNHPSGDLTPSKDDQDLTDRIKKAGEIMGIDVLDHVIIGPGGGWLSMKERGLL